MILRDIVVWETSSWIFLAHETPSHQTDILESSFLTSFRLQYVLTSKSSYPLAKGCAIFEYRTQELTILEAVLSPFL
jgi:hypothetical protein